MITRKQFVAAAAVAAMSVGVLGTAVARPGPHQGGHRGFSPEAATQRMDAMKSALNLAAPQQPLWDAYAARVQQQMQAGMKMREQMQAARGNAEQTRQLQDQAFRNRTEAMADIARLRADLVRTMSVEQATIFRELGPGGMMRARHERMHHGAGERGSKPGT